MSEKILKILTSLKLTVALLIVMILVTVPSTLINQKQTEDYYLTLYPEPIGNLILTLGYDHFYSSPIFLTITSVFWINLFSCSVKRFSAQLRRGRRGRFGPDILHIGLLVLIIGSVFTFSGRQEGTLFMKSGDTMRLPSERYMVLNDFQFERYPDGRPKSWTSEVSIVGAKGETGEVLSIGVNHPLRIDGLVIYQASYRPSDTVGVYETGLMVTRDPGKKFIIVAFILISTGLVFTFISKGRSLK
ncbi:MAG: cytochrome c biogenesis protein ResB [Spirochaetales bacterium]|nr:cytochrome c biogenesis protein ResB [Spirochaetales bacterium]